MGAVGVMPINLVISVQAFNKFKNNTNTVILQWGKTSVTTATKGQGKTITYTFTSNSQISYSNTKYKVIVTPNELSNSSYTGWNFVDTKNSSGFSISFYIISETSGTKTVAFDWISIGY